MQDTETLFERRGKAGLITLNRPKALNALTPTMVRDMHRKLIEWASDPSVALVIVRGAGEKAFCAGGDIRKLHDWGREKNPAMRAFYREEYRLNAYIRSYPKPYVALIDGIVMGGGVGVSVHGSHRVAGGRTMFAMPETGIGFFPDVGGTYFLPRLPDRIGTWLAMSGARLKTADVCRSRIATHYVQSERFEALVDELAASGEADATLAAFASHPSGEGILDAVTPVIERCFDGASAEEIVARLEAESGEQADWARETASTMRGKSPTSVKIALRQMQDGAGADFDECMRIEYRIVSRIEHGHDFYEGVRAVIIDKDHAPKWQPDRLEDVSQRDVDAYFAPLPDELDLSDLDRP